MNNFITKAAALFVTAFMAFSAAFPCAAQEELYGNDGPDYFCLMGMFMAVPDHSCVSKDAKGSMTKEFYYALHTAWHIPEFADYIGLIGDDEFLYYFVQGNGGTMPCRTTIEFTKPVKSYDGYWYVTMTITQRDNEWEDTCKHKFKIAETSSGFLLDDFDDAKEKCRRYINSKSKEFSEIASGMTVSQYIDKNFSKEELSYYSSEDLLTLRSNIQRYLEDVRKFVEKIQ